MTLVNAQPQRTEIPLSDYLEQAGKGCSGQYCLFAEMVINAGFNNFPRSEDSNGYVGGVCRKSGECPYKKEVQKLCDLRVIGHRDVAQTRSVAHYKLLESRRMGYDVGWDGAWDPWVRNGKADDFNKVFNPGMPINELLFELFDRKAG